MDSLATAVTLQTVRMKETREGKRSHEMIEKEAAPIETKRRIQTEEMMRISKVSNKVAFKIEKF